MPTTPYLGENSILAWERQSSKGSVPGTGSDWNGFGRVTEFDSLGPEYGLQRDLVMGAGQEPDTIEVEGETYAAQTLSPFQVRDPRVLGFVFSQEESRSSTSEGGVKHTLKPTDRGELDYMSVAERARKLDGSGDSEDIIYTDTVMPRNSLRGEPVNDDGTGGRLMASPTLLPLGHTRSNADSVDVSLSSATPYRWYHGRFEIDGQLVFRLQEWELEMDRRATLDYYWRDDTDKAPEEAPPEGLMSTLRFTAVADNTTYTVDGQTYDGVRELLTNEVKFDGGLDFTRETGTDAFGHEFTDVRLRAAPLQHGQGKVLVRGEAWIRQNRMYYIDDDDTAYFST